MADSATPTGVQDDATQVQQDQIGQTTAENKEPELSPRELAMQQIADRSDEQRVAEIGGQVTKEPAAGGASPHDQVATQLADEVVIDEAELGRYKVRAKIDGKEEVVPVSEMRQKYQKGGAADVRLDEATRILREAKEHAEASRNAATPPVRDGAAQPAGQTTDQPSDAVQAAKREFLSALMEGDEEKALSAFDKAIQQGRPEPTPAVDPNQLAAQITPAIRQQLVVESALEKFSKDNPDIVADPYLDQLTAGFIEEEVKGGKSFIEALEPAAKKTRDWLASKGVAAPKTTAPTMDRTTKLERKEGIDVIPSLNTKATTVEESVQSASDVIAEMRKARGMTV